MTHSSCPPRRVRRLFAALAWLAILPAAQAATWHVTSLADSGPGTLRDTVNAAGTVNGDLILFDVAGAITLNSPIDVNKDLTIENTQPGLLVQIVSATGTNSLFRVGVGRSVALTRLSLINAQNAVQNNGSLTLTRVLVRGNTGSMGAGVSGCVDPAAQILNVFDSTFLGNAAQNGGGAIAACGQINISGSTFSGNTAVYGGALAVTNTGTVNIINSTFAGNAATGFGGAIQTDYPGLTVRSVTFADNTAPTGATLSVAGGVPVNVSNSIFARGGTGGQCTNVISGTNQNNLRFGDQAPGGNSCGTSLLGDPQLGALGNNGGFTPTMALGAGSAAIDAGAAAGAPSSDQRGIARPQGAGVDIGAYEREAAVTPGDPGAGVAAVPTLGEWSLAGLAGLLAAAAARAGRRQRGARRQP